MRVEAIHFPSVYPPQPTTDGSPVLSQEALRFQPLMAPAMLPQEGLKTRDREAKPQMPDKEEDSETKQPDLPDLFKLIFARDFVELFKWMGFKDHQKIFELTQHFKQHRSLRSDLLFPDYFVQTQPMFMHISAEYEATLFYHYTRPGQRFTGQL